jgi:hypothetical protein
MMPANKAINTDSKKRRSLTALLFAAGDRERYASHLNLETHL